MLITEPETMTTQRAGETGPVAQQRDTLTHAYRARLAHRLANRARAALRARADALLCSATAAALLLPQVALIVGLIGGAA